MSLAALRERVRAAECEVEARRTDTVSRCRNAVGAWRAGWTPGRIVIAGLAIGFLSGRAQPLRFSGSGGLLNLLRSLARLVESSGLAKSTADATVSETDAGAATPPDNDHPAVWPNPPRRTASPFVTTPTP